MAEVEPSQELEVGVHIPAMRPLSGVLADPFAPVLYASEPLVISAEQERAVRNLLLLTSSDTNFAQKAADALRIILSGGINGGIVPVLVTLEPTTGVINAANLKIKCKGTDFQAGATVYVNGNPLPTTFVSATEVTITVTLPATAQTLSILVRNPTGATSNLRQFTVTAVMEEPAEEEVVEEEVPPPTPQQENPFNL